MKVYLETIGCRLNQAEIEQMAGEFRAAGHMIVPEAAAADLAVVNTCAVTAEAAADSRQKVRHASRAGAAEIVVTGCWASLFPSEAGALRGVSRVVPNLEKDLLVPQALGTPRPLFDLEPASRFPLPGLHRRTRAFIKVQDGCDNACTFCITTVARGSGRSVPVAKVLAEIGTALRGGGQEIVLTGVHLGSWGHERAEHLSSLIRAILDDTDTPRLRLSSLEPWDLDEAFFDLWQSPRLMPHLHLPLQSGSAGVLKRMLRKTTRESFRALAAAARVRNPDLALTTDIIAGFPGETEAEFSETLDFINEMGFAGGHVFTYSSRPGTPAARMRSQVPSALKKERAARLRSAFEAMGRDYRRRFVGRTLRVLWESASELGERGWQMEGHADNFLRVRAYAPSPRWNVVDRVLLTGMSEDRLAAEIV